MATCLDLCTDAMILCGELAQGQTPSPEDAQFLFTRINSVLDNLSQDEAWIFSRTIQTYQLTSGIASYAIGPTAPAPFNTPRPNKIDFARILIQIAGAYVGVKDLDIIDYARYVEYSDKTTSGRTAESLYYDNSVLTGNVILYPVPTCAAPTQLELTFWTQLPQFASLVSVFNFPPGYYEALVLLLAVAIMPAYNKPLDQVTIGRAEQCVQRIKTINKMILMPGLPPAAYLPPQAPPAPQQAQQ
jgi:hypothetical protein